MTMKVFDEYVFILSEGGISFNVYFSAGCAETYFSVYVCGVLGVVLMYAMCFICCYVLVGCVGCFCVCVCVHVCVCVCD